MNVYATVILAAWVGEYVLNRVADLLTIRGLTPYVPPDFVHLCDERRYRQSQDYERDSTRFGIWVASFELLLLLGFWAGGGFGWLDRSVRAFGFGPVSSGLLFVGALSAARLVLSLPAEAYGTFVIEARYGLNRTTVRTFVADRVKAVGLAVVLGGPLLAGVLLLLEQGGPWAWLWAWSGVSTFLLVVQYLAPTWLLPLFFRFEPLPAGELSAAIHKLAQTVGFPLTGVFVVDGSRRSAKANAFFTGFSRRKRIALFDTLVREQTTPELVAVLAHELGHWHHGHAGRRLALSILHLGLLFLLLSFFLGSPGLFQAFQVAQPSVYGGLVFFALLYRPIEQTFGVGLNALSRREELAADRFAVAATAGDPAPLASALKKLAVQNLANLTPHAFAVFLYGSHPPVRQRLAAIHEHAEHAARHGIPNLASLRSR